MTTPLQPVITTDGLAAIWRADNTGLAAEITHIGLGTSAYKPDKKQKNLKALKGLYPVSDGQRLSETLLHLTATADDQLEYWVREVGFYLSDGTLLAVWSDPDAALAYKSPAAQLLLAYDLSLSALPANSVTINSTGVGLNLSLAGPLSALASAMISEQLRSLQQQDQQVSQGRLLDIAGQQISALLKRMALHESDNAESREGLLGAAAANAAGLIGEQLRALQQEDRLSSQERLQEVADNRISNLRKRLSATEKDLTEAREGLLAVGISNAIAVIGLQTTVLKNIHGA